MVSARELETATPRDGSRAASLFILSFLQHEKEANGLAQSHREFTLPRTLLLKYGNRHLEKSQDVSYKKIGRDANPPNFYDWMSDVLHGQRADGIEDGEDHDADVGEDGQPHIRDAARAEDQTGCQIGRAHV